MLSNKPLSFDGFNLNYYLVVSWSYYKYLKGSIYHWDTVYQHKWISCASKGQWFRCINMEMGNLQCLDLWIKAVITKWWCGNISGKPPPILLDILAHMLYKYALSCTLDSSWEYIGIHSGAVLGDLWKGTSYFSQALACCLAFFSFFPFLPALYPTSSGEA